MESRQTEQRLVNVTVNLSASLGHLQRSLQHILDIVAFGLNAAETSPKQDLKLPGVFSHWIPAANERLDFEVAKNLFTQWALAGGLRDSVEALLLFLDRIRPTCFLFSVADRQPVAAEEWNRKVPGEAEKFHRLGIGEKIAYLSKHYDLLRVPEADDILAINRARNCLVHRKGIVSDIDCGSGGGLLVTWRALEIVASSHDGDRVISSRMPILKKGDTVGVRFIKKHKLFKERESVLFTVDEFGELLLTLFLWGRELIANLDAYGHSKGVVKSLSPAAQASDDQSGGGSS